MDKPEPSCWHPSHIYLEDKDGKQYCPWCSSIKMAYSAGYGAATERAAIIAEMWDWRKSGDMTNEHIAEAIRRTGESSEKGIG